MGGKKTLPPLLPICVSGCWGVLDEIHSEIKQITGQTIPRFLTILKKEKEEEDHAKERGEEANKGQEKEDTKKRCDAGEITNVMRRTQQKLIKAWRDILWCRSLNALLLINTHKHTTSIHKHTHLKG